MHNKDILKIISDKEGDRIDIYLADLLMAYSRSKINAAIREGAVLLNGKTCKSSNKLSIGDEIIFDRDYFKIQPLRGEDIDLEIIYEDDDLIAINKPAHMLSHPTSSRREGSLLNALMTMDIPLGLVRGEDMAGIVHRLDADTTGLILLAKTDRMQLAMMDAFKNREVKKTYLAILEGKIEKDHISVENFLGRDPYNPKKQAVLNSGRYAHSDFYLLKASDEASFVRVNIHTGRTHQIRVQAQFLGHPLVGDRLYGYRKQRHKTDHQLLHALSLEIAHPFTKKKILLQAGLDSEFIRVLKIYSLYSDIVDEFSTKVSIV